MKKSIRKLFVIFFLMIVSLILSACDSFGEKVKLTLPDRVKMIGDSNPDRLSIGEKVILQLDVPYNDYIYSFTVNGVERRTEVKYFMYEFEIYTDTKVTLILKSEYEASKKEGEKEETAASIVQYDVETFSLKKYVITSAPNRFNFPYKGIKGSTITYESGNTKLLDNNGWVKELPDDDKVVKVIATFKYGNASAKKEFEVSIKRDRGTYKYTPFYATLEIKEDEKIRDSNQFNFKLLGDGTYEVSGLKKEEINLLKVKEIIVPSKYNGKDVTSVGQLAFYNLSSLLKVKLPNTITVINYFAFAKSSNLIEVVIPESVKEIKQKAFEDCISLSQIGIPKSVKTIEHSIFLNCPELIIFCEGGSSPYRLLYPMGWNFLNRDTEEEIQVYWGQYFPSKERK